jgi:rod shape-determining protein MreC
MAQYEAFASNSASPWRGFAERFSSALLAAVAIGLIVLGKIDPALMEEARSRTADSLAPLLTLVQQPLGTVRSEAAKIDGLMALADENARLREENARLKEWQATALGLEAQNQVLRRLVNLGPAAAPVLKTEPIIGEPGGVYVKSVLIAGGAHDGLGKGQPAMAGSGLVGRITELGEWSARVLLITDLNSRIPVMLERSRARAILAGDNSPRPYLMYLPKAATATVGDRIVTTGHDGVFPTGLSVGRVASVDNGEIRVEPIADLDRLEYVTLVDNVGESALTPEAAPARDYVPAEGRGGFLGER